MSKRQGGWTKAENDFYPTPAPAVLPLLPFLPVGSHFYEPCAGAGDLIQHLSAHQRFCVGACDIAPRGGFIMRRNCLDLTAADLVHADVIVTNPPHSHKLLAPIIEHLRRLKPTWLLLPLDWAATKRAAPYLKHCSDIVVIGRMKIIEGSSTAGFDNYAWLRFIEGRAMTITPNFHNHRS